jgi:hypothetical protein
LFILDFDVSIDANIDVDKELMFNQKKCQLDSPHELKLVVWLFLHLKLFHSWHERVIKG